MEIVNRKARHEYIVMEDFVAGLVLQGSEVKSIRAGKCNISDAYCYISSKGEVWMKNSHVAKYDSDQFTNHDELRERKLLLTKKEIRKLAAEVQNPGFTLVPLKIFVDEHPRTKSYGVYQASFIDLPIESRTYPYYFTLSKDMVVHDVFAPNAVSSVKTEIYWNFLSKKWR